MTSLRKWAGFVKRTPLHPQWLLGRQRAPSGIATASGAILDIGAADRWIEHHLPKDTIYYSLDYPSTGRDLYGARPHVFADAAHLPFPDESFDGAVCLEVLEHVPDPHEVVREIARVLKRRGRLWLSMPFLYPLHDAPFDFQRYTEFGLRRDMQRAGLEIVEIRRSGHALRAAGVLMCLAIAGGVDASRGVPAKLLLPLAGFAVLLINLVAWMSSLVWPDWGPMSTGHALEARKP